MKQIYVVIALLATAICGFAQGYRTLEVNLNDGSKVEVSLAEEFSASFRNGAFVVTGVKTDISVPKTDIKSFSFTGNASGVEDISADDCRPVVSGNMMSFTNLPDGSVVSVYNLSGSVLLNEKVSGAYTLDLSAYAGTPVIVKVNKVAYKIAIK